MNILGNQKDGSKADLPEKKPCLCMVFQNGTESEKVIEEVVVLYGYLTTIPQIPSLGISFRSIPTRVGLMSQAQSKSKAKRK